MKLSVGIFSGSVSIISEAIHSTMDLVAAVIAFFSVRISDTPPDQNHPYGHGKFENLSGVIEALLILIAAFWIIYKAIIKIVSSNDVNDLGLGIGAVIMLISALVNFLVSRKLYKVAKETDSLALEADALHLKTDVYTSAGVAVGLLLIWITGYYILDPIVAIIVAIFILNESFNLLSRAFSPLLDSSLTRQEIFEIEHLLKEMQVNYHELKTRKSGNLRFIEFHMEMPPDVELKNVHQFCDEIERVLKEKYKHIEVNIHVEPIGYHKNKT